MGIKYNGEYRMVNCPNCGNEVRANEKFCRKCGTKLATVALQQPSKSNQSKYILVLVAVAILVGGGLLYYSSYGGTSTKSSATSTTSPTAAPATTAPPVELPTYSGTLYITGPTGHFAIAIVNIDPSDSKNPILVRKLTREKPDATNAHNFRSSITTPDGKYSIQALTVPFAEGMEKDGQVQLYDTEARKTIGEPATVCSYCHPDGMTLEQHGLDGVLEIN